MRLSIFLEPQQGATYEDQLAVARATEDLGFDGLSRSDHYLHMGDHVSGLPGPTDAWITLAGLARDTSRIRLGTLMTAATFRHPGPLAIAVAQVDRMSGGRVEFGFGAGWFEQEHAAYGIPFPASARERFDRYEEQLDIITGLWSTPVGETFRYEGRHYRLAEGPALPKPQQGPRPPVVIGGTGPKRTPRLAARFADEYNVPFCSVEETAAAFGRTAEAVRSAGRAAPMVYSAAQVLCVGRDEAEVARRAERIGREVSDLRRDGLAGTPDEVVDKIGRFAEAGAERMYLQVLDMADLDHLELVASAVAPRLDRTGSGGGGAGGLRGGTR
ncbi:LLM class F420-dependent oxidoreductase [Nocardiopsis alba]|uniref:LLM class F420-dependent oxidoreductase n=1 Tax=Nocardiopsis alba TaxID=53437 RepID=UPI0035DDEE69